MPEDAIQGHGLTSIDRDCFQSRKVSITQKFELLVDYRSSRIVGANNDWSVRPVNVKGEFVWHNHEEEDEPLLVMKEQLTIKSRDRDVDLKEGEFVTPPRGSSTNP